MTKVTKMTLIGSIPSHHHIGDRTVANKSIHIFLGGVAELNSSKFSGT